MKVLGVESVSYVSKKTGHPVSGTRLHLSGPKKGCDGVAVESCFCRSDAFQDGIPVPGDEVRVFYNRYGNVDSVVLDN